MRAATLPVESAGVVASRQITHAGQPAPVVLVTHVAPTSATDRLHPGVFALAVASYAALLLCLWVLFASDAVTSLSLAVCTVYFGMFFGVPIVMYRVTAKGEPRLTPVSLHSFLRGKFETDAGVISGWAALTQILVVPACVTFGVLCIGVIFNATG